VRVFVFVFSILKLEFVNTNDELIINASFGVPDWNLIKNHVNYPLLARLHALVTSLASLDLFKSLDCMFN
jgi:hypothetical protein